ncbi:MAG: 2-C-methyl-D-erythritol 2,4-cyclodiphosphate synthase [Pyrinomonadaceae bacterium]
MIRIGYGSDIHRLIEGRPLIIGGVSIESCTGADGHSDADVLTHAITDAIFGALALGDIGTHFPNSDERWRNAESSMFLRFAVQEMRKCGYSIANVDSTISLESPRLQPYADRIRKTLSVVLDVPENCISVKAKTNEGLDSVGTKLAIRADAVVLIQS